LSIIIIVDTIWNFINQARFDGKKASFKLPRLE